MEVNFKEFKKEDANTLYNFLKSEEWKFHSGSPNTLTEEKIAKLVEENYYSDPDTKCFWILNQDNEKIGFLKLEEIEDEMPSFDLRVSTKYRGKGIGEQALRWLTDYVFKTYPNIYRMEGCTREDNIAMRKVFKKCGYIKEGHIRKAWPPPGGTDYKQYYDSIRYGILRNDWEEGKITPLNWDDDNL